jgi:hypothetical protein
MAGWMGTAGVPLFVSARVLRKRRSVPMPAAPWALDSGAFTELSLNGKWTISAHQYVEEVRRWRSTVGGMQFAAPQDWPCEPVMREKTGLTVREHQRLTTENYLLLTELAPEVPWLPVLQGWEYREYLDHLGDYRAAGVDLAAAPLTGLGSVCRRGDTNAVEELARELHRLGLRLHAFGFKVRGLLRSARWLASADSMAWSFAARRGSPLPGCAHKTCANCLRYALAWREKVLRSVSRGLARPLQTTLW